MSQDPQAWNQQDETIGTIPSGQFYLRVADTGISDAPKSDVGIPTDQFNVRPASTGIGADLPRPENSPTSKGQSNEQPANKGKNNGLNKALLGGLLGATLGTLAAALANKRTSEAANHAAKGVGKAVKSVAEGANHAAKGVGEGVKTVTEGVNYAVVGTVVDALKNTAETAQKSVESSKDLGQTANYVNPAQQQSQPQTTYVLIPVEKERVIERTIIIEEPTTPDTGEVDFTPDEFAQQMPDNQQTSQFDEQRSDFNQQTSQFDEQRPDFLG